MSSVNGRTLDTIHHSVMCLSLDHFISPTGSSQTHPRGCKMEMREHLHLVRSSWGGRNRFMDKPFSFVVDPLTRAGAMGEHSPVDALAPSIVTEYAIVQGISDDSYISSPEAVSGDSSTPNGWRSLEWVTDNRIELECRKSGERAKAMIADSDDNVFHFSAYGADWIKAQGQSRHTPTLHRSRNGVLTKSSTRNSQPGSPQTHTSRWHSNWRGSEREAASPRPTRRRSHGCFSMGGRRPSEH